MCFCLNMLRAFSRLVNLIHSKASIYVIILVMGQLRQVMKNLAQSNKAIKWLSQGYNSGHLT